MLKKISSTLILSLSLFLTSNLSYAASTSPSYIKNLPNEKNWLAHAKVLEKYWLMPEAYGIPIGKFPTWRCNDGSLRNKKKCPDEVKEPPFLPFAKYDYVRMISRQTFGYGALFNLTGNAELLRLHLAGVEFLLDYARDPEGGFYGTFNGDDTSYPERLARTPQDLAYALIGLAMNAYLTNNPQVIKVITDTQKYIYKTYYDDKKNLLRWVLKDSDVDKTNQLELVAQLDQLNAYLLLTWRLLPPKERNAWSHVITQTISMMNDNFYDKKSNKYYGCIHERSCFDEYLGRHSDYGHRVKSFWMVFLAACGLGDRNLINFGKEGILQTLHLASTKNQTEWFGSINKEPASWWIGAELDQAALTLTLNKQYVMPNTLFPWINNRVDTKYGELNDGLKTHLWRSAFHSTEHALVGYIASQGIRAIDCKRSSGCLRDNQVDLYFAPSIGLENVIYTPYLFSGTVKKAQITDNEYGVIKVTFEKIGIPKPVIETTSYKVGAID